MVKPGLYSLICIPLRVIEGQNYCDEIKSEAVDSHAVLHEFKWQFVFKCNLSYGIHSNFHYIGLQASSVLQSPLSLHHHHSATLIHAIFILNHPQYQSCFNITCSSSSVIKYTSPTLSMLHMSHTLTLYPHAWILLWSTYLTASILSVSRSLSLLDWSRSIVTACVEVFGSCNISKCGSWLIDWAWFYICTNTI